MIRRTPVHPDRRRRVRIAGARSAAVGLLATVAALGLVTVAGCQSPEQARPGICLSISGEELACDAFRGYLSSQLGEGEGSLDDAALSSLFDQ
ncbi:MAG: hypothetical protein AAFX50_26375, partial [Acidobacteriota bacterium]